MSSDAQGIKEQLRQYIVQEFLPGEDPANVGDDLALKSSGVLDSVSTLKLVTYVEDSYGITVEPHEASTDFETIADIAALVERKKK